MTNELVTVLDGKLKLTIGGEEIIAEPGDKVFIPQGVRHFRQECFLLHNTLAIWVRLGQKGLRSISCRADPATNPGPAHL